VARIGTRRQVARIGARREMTHIGGRQEVTRIGGRRKVIRSRAQQRAVGRMQAREPHRVDFAHKTRRESRPFRQMQK
jgi:hypothetical protein